ncbi:MAG: 5-(carboxyamino)imidazole ribonucleotide mutase [Candidatus Micrarchaeota archaeon]|nr:5-(carboxyamino)imidazole ribonucleotide mutase [Candidatus Micrarchaeota archaeon]
MVDVLVIAGSKSDKKIADDALAILKEFGVSSDFQLASAHRAPDKVEGIVRNTDAKVIIAIAGLSAALPGFIASRVTVPVIGVPVNVKLDGLDALLSTMQMPDGVPVACVSIDGGKNAAMLAVEILATSNPGLKEKLAKYRKG